MKMQTITRVLAAAIATSAVAYAQDECSTAAAAALGNTAFDTTTATPSIELWNCASGGGPDLWYTYTAANTNDIVIETCGSSYDTALEVFSGACGALVLIECNDDFCGLQSTVSISGVTAGTTYTFRVGGWNGNSGTGAFDISEVTPPPPLGPNCVETLFASNNGGAVDGAVYFDMTLTQGISVDGLVVNTGSTAAGIGADLYMFMGSHVGNETAAGWMLLASGDFTANGAGINQQTAISFVSPASIPAGTNGFAIAAQGFNHSYTNGDGTNQNHVSADGVITLDLGSATNAAFTGTPFTPRVWNGIICSAGPVSPGTNYCMAELNSTGSASSVVGSGSNSIAANDLSLEVVNLPMNAFAFFVTSQTQGFVPMPGGSSGNLCLSGNVGRYVGPGQIQNSGATGSVSLAIDNTLIPQPTGFVSGAVGETWNFQLWHRDSNMMGATSNFSDGYEVTFSM